MKLLSAERIDNLLRYWLQGQGALQPPSEAQLGQLREQALSTQPDAHPLLDIAGLTLMRERGLLNVVPDFFGSEPPSDTILIEWRGEEEIAIPSWHGTLSVQPGAAVGFDPGLLSGQPMRLVARTGNERLKLDLQRPSRTLKNLFQEAALPAWTRPWLPLIYVGDQLAYAAGLGADVRLANCVGGIQLSWKSGVALPHL